MADPERWIHATNAAKINVGDVISWHERGLYPQGVVTQIDAANLRVRVRPAASEETHSHG